MVNPEVSSAVAENYRQEVQADEEHRVWQEAVTKSREIAQQAGTDALELVHLIGIDESYDDVRGSIYDANFSKLVPLGSLDGEEGFRGETHAFGRVYVMRQLERRTVTTKGRTFRHTDVIKVPTDTIDSFGVAWFAGNADGSKLRPVDNKSWSIPDAGNLELLETVIKRVEIVREALPEEE